MGGVLYFGGDGPAAEEASNERAADDLAALAAELPEATAPAEATEETGDEDAPALRLRRPALPGAWSEPETPERTALIARAYQFNAPVYERPARRPEIQGVVRRGRAIPIEGRAYGEGCRNGRWYRTTLGVVCTSDGFEVDANPEERDQKPADFTGPMPYRYAAVGRRDGALRFFRIPNVEELASAEGAASAGGDEEPSFPEVVQQAMVGDFFVALDRVEQDGWQRTVRGHYVATDELEELETPPMVGSHLDEETTLPLAFVYGEDRPLYRVEEDGVREVGVAEKHARFSVRETLERDGVTYLVGEGGLAVRRDAVRLARETAPEERIPSDVRWVHVDLAEQTLVAYDGGEPVFATLVSSGKEGYDTPRGVFRIREKYVSITMSGDDPVDGAYEVEEEPWTMYYWKSYALHGAYWHGDFGNVRSHGCTNLAPADARWLFEWTSPDVPAGWHGRRLRRGTWVWFSRGDAGYDAS